MLDVHGWSIHHSLHFACETFINSWHFNWKPTWSRGTVSLRSKFNRSNLWLRTDSHSSRRNSEQVIGKRYDAIILTAITRQEWWSLQCSRGKRWGRKKGECTEMMSRVSMGPHEGHHWSIKLGQSKISHWFFSAVFLRHVQRVYTIQWVIPSRSAPEI